MAREMIVKCDASVRVTVKDCGESHEDTVRTFTIKTDGEAWEIDLGGPHAEAILEIARRGRKVETGGTGRKDQRALDRRIRNAPAEE